MAITFNFGNINNPLNNALLLLLKAQSFFIDTCLCYLRKLRIQFPVDGDLLVHVMKVLLKG